jgi:uncharacterized membrane protein required for colicin V production
MDVSADFLKTAYYCVSAIGVAALGWSGWKQGIARQLMTLAAIGCAYAAAYYGASSAAPVFAFLKYPPQIIKIIAGVAVGLATFLGVHGLRRWLFKRTADQPKVSGRLSYGMLGAILGVAFGALIVIGTTVFFARAIGVAAKARVDEHQREAREHDALPPVDPGPLVRNFAKLGSALDEGLSGKFVRRYDNSSITHAFATIAKLTIMASRQETVERFLSYPGVAKLAQHPKLVALKDDPEVLKLLESRSFVKLLKHAKVLALASDPDFKAAIEKMEFEKALDYALEKPKPKASADTSELPREALVTPPPAGAP